MSARKLLRQAPLQPQSPMTNPTDEAAFYKHGPEHLSLNLPVWLQAYRPPEQRQRCTSVRSHQAARDGRRPINLSKVIG